MYTHSPVIASVTFPLEAPSLDCPTVQGGSIAFDREDDYIRPRESGAQKARAELGLRGWVALGLPFTSQLYAGAEPCALWPRVSAY